MANKRDRLDGDGILDAEDSCPSVSNTNPEETDGDGMSVRTPVIVIQMDYAQQNNRCSF